MRDLNSWIGTGRIGKDIEVKSTPTGKSVANFSLAVAFDEKVDWVMCVAWDKAAEALSKYARKGDRLTIMGRLMTREYQHNGENRKVTEINVEKIVFPDRKKEESTIPMTNEPLLDETSDDSLPF